MKKGYTLIEIVLALVMLVIITHGLGVYIMQGIDAWLLLRARNALQAEARTALSRMLDEFRNIPNLAAVTGYTYSTSECTFLDQDGVSTHDFKLDYDGSNYFLNYNGTSLSDHLTSDGLQFTYLDVNDYPVYYPSTSFRSIRFKLKFQFGDEVLRIETACRLRVI